MNRQRNGTILFFALGLIILIITLILALSNAGFGIGDGILTFLGIFCSISLIAAGFYFLRRFLAAKKIAEHPLLFLSYTQEQWESFVRSNLTAKRKDNFRLTLLLALVAFLSAALTGWIASNLLLGILLFLAFMCLDFFFIMIIPSLEQRFLNRGPCQAIIAATGILLGKEFHPFAEKGTQPEQIDRYPDSLKITYSAPCFLSGTLAQSTVSIPLFQVNPEALDKMFAYFSNLPQPPVIHDFSSGNGPEHAVTEHKNS